MDSAKGNGATWGSMHAIDLFGSRRNIKVTNCTLMGIRTTCIKVSGSGAPLRNIMMTHNTAISYGALTVCDADDANEHTNILIGGNLLQDGRDGASRMESGRAISIMGAGGVIISNNLLHFRVTRSTLSEGQSQPIEDLQILNNKFTANPYSTKQSKIYNGGIGVNAVERSTRTAGLAGAARAQEAASQAPGALERRHLLQ